MGIDFDSTVARIDLPWLSRLNAMRGTSYRPEDWADWDLSFLREPDRRVFLALLTPDLYEVVEPYPGAAEAIRSLSLDAPVELVCVTTNPDNNSAAFTAAKARWLRKHIPQLADSLVIAGRKSGLGLDLLIDDAPHHSQSEDYVPVLIDRPWNKSLDAPFRFNTWHEGEALVRSLVERIATGKYEHSRHLS